jgi:LacI family transcriptional regulator, xylobiose transport system transcriptional regulator
MTAENNGARSEARGRRDVTVADIARRAGVSAPTVSKVINGHSGVALDTRVRIEKIIEESGYRRIDASPPIAILEIVFQALDSLWALEIIRGVEAVARDHGLAVAITETRGRLTPGNAWIEQLLQRRPTGVIAVSSELSGRQQSQLSTRGIPLVTLDPTGEPAHDTPSVGAANWNGGLLAGRHLTSLGHRRLAMITGPDRYLCCRARRDGFVAAADAAGLPEPPVLSPAAPLYVEGGIAAADALLSAPTPPTAIFTANDLQALGVYAAAQRRGLRIPDDLSVVGFDDLPFVRWSNPPLTTIRQPLTDMGAAAAHILIGPSTGTPPSPIRVELPVALVARASTAPPHRHGQ